MIFSEKSEDSIEIIIDIIIEYVLHNCYPQESIPTLLSAISNWMGNFIKDSSLESISQLFTLIDVAVMSSFPIDITV
jgi:predicted transcriptional regulator